MIPVGFNGDGFGGGYGHGDYWRGEGDVLGGDGSGDGSYLTGRDFLPGDGFGCGFDTGFNYIYSTGDGFGGGGFGGGGIGHDLLDDDDDDGSGEGYGTPTAHRMRFASTP